jgi:hypothetical protein
MIDSTNFLFNCSDVIDWNEIIDEIKDKPGKPLIPDRALWNEKNPGYGKLLEMWEKSNFNFNSIKWSNYYPGKDYTDTTISIFENLLKVGHVRSWISRIDPGYCTPWHWDTDDNEEEYLKLGELKRFTCHISVADYGQVFLIGKEAHYFWKQGDLHEWSNYKAWHAGMNCGTSSKFLYNFLGYI